MRLIVFTMTLAMTIGLAAAAGQENSDGGPTSKILALESAWDRAIENKDLSVLDGLFDNALVYVEYDGTLMTKAEVLSRIKAGNSEAQRIAAQPMMVRVFGTTAVVFATYQEKGMEHGKPYQRRGRFIDTWVFKDGRWVCVAAQATLLLH
jgi:ketosteroid isomerase-like protein